MRPFRLGVLSTLLALPLLQGATPTSHTVQSGETVYAIAKKYGTTTPEILKANPGLNPARLHAGDKIRLPFSSLSETTASPFPTQTISSPTPSPGSPPANEPSWITIRKGDTLSKIARENSITTENLRQWNRLSGDTIRPGDRLQIRAPSTPPANLPAPSPPKKTPPPSVAPERKSTPPTWRFVGPVRPQIEAPKNRLRDWEYIVVHHSGTSGGNAAVFEAYHSRERGMENGMAYHFVIGNGADSGDGQIEIGRRWLRQLQGGHLASETLNEISIGICLVGDFSRHRLGPRQTAALIELVQYLRAMMPENRLKFRLHREINTRPTECPGRLFPAKAMHEILDSPVLR